MVRLLLIIIVVCFDGRIIFALLTEMSESARTSVIGESHRDSFDDAAMKPALIKSLFSNCAPVINFGTKHEKGAILYYYQYDDNSLWYVSWFISCNQHGCNCQAAEPG